MKTIKSFFNLIFYTIRKDIIVDINKGKFFIPFIKLFLTGFIILYINIISTNYIVNSIDLNLIPYIPIFVGITSVSLLFGTGSSIFIGSNFDKIINNKFNTFNKVINIIVLGSIFISSILCLLTLLFNNLFFKDLNNIFYSLLLMYLTLIAQNVFTSLNIVLRTLGKVYFSNLLSIISIFSIYLIHLNYIPLLIFLLLTLLIIVYFKKSNLINNINNAYISNSKYKYLPILKNILILGLPTFLVQFISLIIGVLFIVIPSINYVNTILEITNTTNIIIVSFTQSIGIIFTYNFYNTSISNKQKRNEITLSNIHKSMIIFTIISLLIETVILLTPNLSLDVKFFFSTYIIFGFSIVLGGLYNSIGKIFTSIFLSTIKFYCLFIPINIYFIMINLIYLKLYSSIISDIIVLIILIIFYIKLKNIILTNAE